MHRKINIGLMNRIAFIHKAMSTVKGAQCLILILALCHPALIFAIPPELDTHTPQIKGDPNQASEREPAETDGVAGKPSITINGGIELNYEYLDPNDIGDPGLGDSSDFYTSTAELIFRAIVNKWIKAKCTVALEDFGKQGEDERIRTDNAIFTLENPWIPLYMVIGKTDMPFGVFENHLIEGALIEDLYEVDQWGAILGFNPDFYQLDISLSVYRNPQIIKNLEDFETHEFSPDRPESGKFESFIANISLVPIEEMLALSLFYDNEPGDGARNQSLGAGLTLEYSPFILNLEFITALTREKGENGEENKEHTGVAGLAVDLLDGLQAAMRYDRFWDDTQPDRDEVLRDRTAVGFNIFLDEYFSMLFMDEVTLSFEYRYSRFEQELGSEAADSEDMVQFQLSLQF